MPTDTFKELILSQIQTIQSKIAEEQGLTAESKKEQLQSLTANNIASNLTTIDKHNPSIHSDNDMPLASKETLQLDSHRPLTYETQHLRQTNYNIKTPNMDDFITRETINAENPDDA